MRVSEDIRKRVIEEYKLNGENINKSQLANDIGVHRVTVRKIIAKEFPETIEIKAKTIDDFRLEYDDEYIINKKIEEGIEKYLTIDGKPGYLTDEAFRLRCDVSRDKWRRHNIKWNHLQIKHRSGGKVWGHPDIIDQMKEIVHGR